MNTTTTNSGGGTLGGYNDIGGLTYGISVLFVALILIITISIASYFCIHSVLQSTNHLVLVGGGGHQLEPMALAGLDEATIESYPKLTFSEAAKLHSKGGGKLEDRCSTAFCCSICLADYIPTDKLRSLPECGHLFHQKCVDPWLRLHPTCPVCRSSPMPTPLAEVVPLAMATSRRDIPI